MPSAHTLSLFFVAAFVLAVTPGPGLLYIASRTLAAGRADGFASSLGTMLGGLVHVLAAAIGVSALVMASAAAFTALKLVGGLYLIYLGVQMWRSASASVPAFERDADGGVRRAFQQGVLVEATNPKTAAFFLALIPQFVDLAQGLVALQFVVLGLISIILNTVMAFLVVLATSAARHRFTLDAHVVRRLRQGSGAVLAGLGVSLLLVRRPA